MRSSALRHILAATALATAAVLSAQPAWDLADESIMQVDEIKQGMAGEVRTVFQGTRIE